MLRVVTAAIACAAALAVSGSALAGGKYYDRYYGDYYGDYGDYYGYYADPYPPEVVIVPRRVEVYPPPPVVRAPYAPPVYGWVIERPASCGEYRYWTGVRCADARYRPPYVGPRW